ncbi:MAG: hypothetical protein AAF432_00685 [Planctomycetota bacterium]
MKQSIERRIQILEHENERVRRHVQLTRMICFLLTLVVAFGVFAGLQEAPQDPGELTLRKLTIVDRMGNDRITLKTDGEDGVFAGLAIRDRNDRIRLIMSTDEDRSALMCFDDNQTVRWVAQTKATGDAGTRLFDSNGNHRIATNSGKTGVAETMYLDKDGKTRLVHATDGTGVAVVRILDIKGTDRINWVSTPQGRASAIHFDAAGIPRALLGTDVDRRSHFGLLGQQSEVRWGAAVLPDETVSAGVFDSNGAPRAAVTVDKDDNAGFLVLDQNGVEVIRAMVGADGSLVADDSAESAEDR